MKIKLTDSELELMEIIWSRGTAFMKDILEAYPEPKPASTTVATLLKRMHSKGAINYKLYGNSREYSPMISKEIYFGEEMNSMIDRFFNSSVSQFASFFTGSQQLSQDQLKELRDIIDHQIKR